MTKTSMRGAAPAWLDDDVEMTAAEVHDWAEGVAAYVRSAAECTAYLGLPFMPPEPREGADPLDVALYWEEPEFGSDPPIFKINLREALLEMYEDDPKYYASQRAAVVGALRRLADDIDAICSEPRTD